MGFPERVVTERLVLRRWRKDDHTAFQRIWADPNVWRALRPGAPFDPAYGAQRFSHHLDHWSRHGFGLWAVWVREERQIAGWVGLNHPESPPQFAADVEVGWTLRPHHQGRGLASEGAAAAVTAGFQSLDLDRVISLIAPTNAPSIAVARRLGMRHLHRVQRTPSEGRSPALTVYALHRPSWKAGRTPETAGRVG